MLVAHPKVVGFCCCLFSTVLGGTDVNMLYWFTDDMHSNTYNTIIILLLHHLHHTAGIVQLSSYYMCNIHKVLALSTVIMQLTVIQVTCRDSPFTDIRYSIGLQIWKLRNVQWMHYTGVTYMEADVSKRPQIRPKPLAQQNENEGIMWECFLIWVFSFVWVYWPFNPTSLTWCWPYTSASFECRLVEWSITCAPCKREEANERNLEMHLVISVGTHSEECVSNF